MTARYESVIIKSELLVKVGTFKEVIRMYWLYSFFAIVIAFLLFAAVIGVTAIMIISSLIYCVISVILGIFGLQRFTKYVFALVMAAYLLGFL